MPDLTALKIKIFKLITAASLLTEQLSIAFWRSMVWVLFFAGLWILQIPEAFGRIFSVLIWFIFFFGLGYLLYKDLKLFKRPDRKDIERRIEKDSASAHRPLSSLDDNPVDSSNPDQKALWDRHLEFKKQQLKSLRPGPPLALLAKRDPYALRLLAILFFITAVVVAGPGWTDNMRQGLWPFDFSRTSKPVRIVSFKINPPAYTEIEPFIASKDVSREAPLAIPEGSTLEFFMNSRWLKPNLKYKELSLPFERMNTQSFSLSIPAPGESGELAVYTGFIPRQSWPFEIIRDQPPQTEIAGEPEVLHTGGIRFPLKVVDDYGITKLDIHVAVDNEIEPPAIGQTYEEFRIITSRPGEWQELFPLYDLSSHPWAGLPVNVTFVVHDAKEQTAVTEPLRVVLPRRIFQHPVSKALIDKRRQLIWEPLKDYSVIAPDLEALLQNPGTFQNDFVAFLSIKAAAMRLYYNHPSREVAQSVIDLLWNVAIRIEDGNLSLASDQLRAIKNRLQRALENGESNEELQILLEDLQSSLQEYFTELQKELQKQTNNGLNSLLTPESFDQILTPQKLLQSLEELGEAIRNGDIQRTNELLSELNQLLDSLSPSVAQGLPPDMQMMADGINELQELIDRQKNLLEQTEEQAKLHTIFSLFADRLSENHSIQIRPGFENLPMPSIRKNEGDELTINTQDNYAEQEALRLILGQLMLEASDVLGNIPENFGLAERAMHRSGQRLLENRPDQAVPHQEKAIEELEKSQESLKQQIRRRMQSLSTIGLTPQMLRRDPLGRAVIDEGDMTGSDVTIPDENERQRVHEILRLLRDRAGQSNLPEEELNYYRRLLRRF